MHAAEVHIYSLEQQQQQHSNVYGKMHILWSLINIVTEITYIYRQLHTVWRTTQQLIVYGKMLKQNNTGFFTNLRNQYLHHQIAYVRLVSDVPMNDQQV